MNRPAFSVTTIALVCALASPVHAQTHEHGHHHTPETKPATEAEAIAHDHSAHAGNTPTAPTAHSGHEHSSGIEPNHSSHDHHHHPGSGPAFPPITDADRTLAFPDLGDMTMADHGMDDNAIHFKALFDGLEWRNARDGGSDSFAWNATTWLGRDIDKLWLRTAGERRAGRTGNAHIEALWGHAIGPWWDTVAGIRHDTRPGHSYTRAALGVQGLAPYQFEVAAMLYLGGPGKAELQLEAEYELLLTYRWILTPSLATGLTAESDPRHGIHSGWNGLETALKLRYEIRPDLAPYIGYRHHSGGNTPEAEKDGQWIAGLRFWF